MKRRWIYRTVWVVVLMGTLPLLANLGYTSIHYYSERQQILETNWVDSVYARLSVRERIGQLFMIRAYSNKDQAYEESVANQIREYGVGGLCFFQGTPRRQAELTNEYQRISQVPLLIAMDAEWGLGMRLDGPEVVDFPRQIALGAIEDDHLIYLMGREIARQLRRIGTQVNFAPVADINNNPDNPVINFRSFGEDRYKVAEKCSAYMQGLQDGQVMACAKHFPGHGDTDTDSHKALPVILHSRQRLDSIELYPFRQLAANGLQSVMVAHLNIPALDDAFQIPTTLSTHTVQDLLRQEIGFDGIVFTDAMDMNGVTQFAANGEAEWQALAAGNDILLLPSDLPKAIDRILEAVRSGEMPLPRLETHVKRILRTKYRLGLASQQPVDLDHLEDDLNPPISRIIRSRLIEQSITLVRNRDNLIPFKELHTLKLAVLNIGDTLNNAFQSTLSAYTHLDRYAAPKEFGRDAIRMWKQQLSDRDVVIVGLFDQTAYPKNNFGLTSTSIEFLHELNEQTPVVVVNFGNPYGLQNFDDLSWVVQSYQADPLTQVITAEGLMGHMIFQGHLPVTSSQVARAGMGRYGDNLMRLGYADPERVGMSADTLARIDEVIRDMIRNQAAPGGQILVIKDRKVVMDKSFGNLTYDTTSRAVDHHTIYDLASVTKAAATTLAVMKLVDEERIDPEEPLGVYLPECRNKAIADIRIRDLLTHSSGLPAWIPFYEKTLKRKRPSRKFYRDRPEPGFSIPVADHLYMKDAYRDELWSDILNLKPGRPGPYVYSDLGFMLLQRMVESVADQPLDQYVDQQFYQPLGLESMTFHPMTRQLPENIAPTENDTYFRQQEVRGYVHDMAAAMLGGVAGHAGLFSNAGDLGILFQMLLNDGVYGGVRFLQPGTIRQFTTRAPDQDRRGWGFDMKDKDGPNTHVSPQVSDRAFGHLGFTGTCVWADPEHDLIYIFLSNRTWPSMTPNRLQEGRYRQQIQSIIYRSFLKNPPL